MMRACTAICSLLAASGAAVAQVELFVSEYQFQNAGMTAMGLDGSNPQPLFTLPPAQWLPLGLTYRPDTQRLIWMDSAGASEVMSANLDGSNPLILATPPGFARGASLDAKGRIFFSTNNTVCRVNADGSGFQVIHTSQGTDPVSAPRVDAFNGRVYVGDSGDILRMNLDGGNVKRVVRGSGQPRAIGLDIGAGYVYWLDGDTNTDFVGRARLDGTDFTVLIDISPGVVQSPGGIEMLVDPAGGSIFYADELTGQVFRAGLNGESPTLIYTTPAGRAPSGMVLSTGEPAQPLQDCNNNGIDDDIDILNGAPDCDNNGVPDTCQVNPCPNRVLLLDQGSNAANTQGRALGVPSEWQIFQPFDVPAGGWQVGEIAVDGYTVNYADGSGITLTVFPDDGTLTRPNEAQTLGSAQFNLLFNTNLENWVYTPVALSLPQGRFWVRLEANNPTLYSASINLGFSGLQSLSRGSSGTFSSPAPPIALRIVEGVSSCYANCDGSTTAPVLNVNDFVCFQQRFAAGEPYANCDGSTTPPVLNVNDFVCFQQQFAAGCP